MSAAAYRFAPLSDVSGAALAAFIAQREASCVSCAAQLLRQRLLVPENEPRLLCRAAEMRVSCRLSRMSLPRW